MSHAGAVSARDLLMLSAVLAGFIACGAYAHWVWFHDDAAGAGASAKIACCALAWVGVVTILLGGAA